MRAAYKVPVVIRGDYTIYLQDIEGTAWAHCDVRRWSAAVSKAIRQDADALYRLHGGPWFALNEPAGCQKHAKFLRHVGFSLLKALVRPDGAQYIYQR